MSTAAQEIRWVVRAQSGDAEALDALLKNFQDPLYAYLVRLVGDYHAAQDVLQDVFVQVIKNIGWLREPRFFRPWAYRIASREAFRWLRRERRLSALTEDESALDSVAGETATEEVDVETRQRLLEMLGDVSPASRAVLSLHYLEGMTLQEVADVLEISLAAVKSRLAYGLVVLRKKVAFGR
jgi:RNA polymerase sigma-70 factor (ECF subfamily)